MGTISLRTLSAQGRHVAVGGRRRRAPHGSSLVWGVAEQVNCGQVREGERSERDRLEFTRSPPAPGTRRNGRAPRSEGGALAQLRYSDFLNHTPAPPTLWPRSCGREVACQVRRVSSFSRSTGETRRSRGARGHPRSSARSAWRRHAIVPARPDHVAGRRLKFSAIVYKPGGGPRARPPLPLARAR